MWRCFQKSLTAGLWNTGLKMKRLWRKQKRLIRTCWSGFRSMLSEIWNKVVQCFLRLEHEIYQLLLYPMVWFESVSIKSYFSPKLKCLGEKGEVMRRAKYLYDNTRVLLWEILNGLDFGPIYKHGKGFCFIFYLGLASLSPLSWPNLIHDGRSYLCILSKK